MPKKPTSELSHGGRFYRAHRERELQRKRNLDARWRSAHVGFLRTHLDLSISEEEFRAEARREGWLPPNHSPKRRPSRRVDEGQRSFVEEALGRQYDAPTYDVVYGFERLRGR